MDDKDASERYFCPFPGCKRSFAELWRLKVHYRAPPDIRGSGKERGHGCELTHCPKCGKGLKPGKHHVGCSGSKTAPRQAKRSRQAGGNGSGLPNDGMTADVQGMYSAGMMVQGSYAPGMPAPAPNGYAPVNGGYHHQQYQGYPQQYQPDMSGSYYQGQINPMAPSSVMQQQPMQQVQAQPPGGVPSPALMGVVQELGGMMPAGNNNLVVQPDALMSTAHAQAQPVQYQYQQPAPMPATQHVLQHQGSQSQDMLQPLLQPGMDMQQVMHQPMQQQSSMGVIGPAGMVPYQQQQQQSVAGMMDPMAQALHPQQQQQQQQQSFPQQVAGITSASSGTFMPQPLPHPTQLVQQHSGGVSQTYIGLEPAAGVSAAAAAGLMPPPPPVAVMQVQQPQQLQQQPQMLPAQQVVPQQQQHLPPQAAPAAAHMMPLPVSPSSTSSNTAVLLPPGAPPGAPQLPAASTSGGFSSSLFDELDHLDAAAGPPGAVGPEVGPSPVDPGRAPSPPPLPADFPQAAGQGMLFNFSQFSQKLPAAAPPSQQMAMMPRGMEQELPPSMDDLWTPEATYDHHSDGDLMQLLFGAPEQPPTMATIHLHHFLEDDACSSPLLTGMIGGSMDDLNAAARQAAAHGQQCKQEEQQLEDAHGAVGSTKGLMLPPAAVGIKAQPALHQQPQTPQQLPPQLPVEHMLMKQELVLPMSPAISQQYLQQPMSYVPPNGSAGVVLNGQCGTTGMVQIKGEDGNCLLHKAEFTVLPETLASRAT